jgi:SSS family solute:Na+ symporter
MLNRSLSYLRVASLLVSTSYGIGFLFGSGELALRLGMAGSIYAVVTAIGMVTLALLAKRLWAAGRPIWDILGHAYGHSVKRIVVLLSVVWMSGVLAAQIEGGVAVVMTTGLPRGAAYGIVLALICAASAIELSFASALFACCLLASNVILLYVLTRAGGWYLYFHAIPIFVADLRKMPAGDVLATGLAIAFLVVTGADYQQFVIAGRREIDAWLGCTLAAAFLFLISFLPAATVIAVRTNGTFLAVQEPKQVVPMIFIYGVGKLGNTAQLAMVLILLTAALGAGAAIARAMAQAVTSCLGAGRFVQRSYHCVATLALTGMSAVVAAHGQGIVNTMIDLNIVYIASIGTLFLLHYVGLPVPPQRACLMMGTGFSVSVALYIVEWVGLLHFPKYATLLSGIALPTAVGLHSSWEQLQLRNAGRKDPAARAVQESD